MVSHKEEEKVQQYEKNEGYSEANSRMTGRTEYPDGYYERGRMMPSGYSPMAQERYSARRPRYNQPQGNPYMKEMNPYYEEYDEYYRHPHHYQEEDHDHHDLHHYHGGGHWGYDPYTSMGAYAEPMGDYRRGMRPPGYGMGPRGYGMRARGYGMGPQGYGMGPQGYGMGPYGRPMSPWRNWLSSNFVGDWLRSPRAGNIFRGIGIATAGIILAPSIAKAIRPLVVQAVHGAMSVVGEFKGIVADAKEDIEDIFADAKWENMKEDNGGE